MEGYFRSDRNLKLVVLLVDIRHKPSADDYGMIEFLQHYGFNFAVVLTKSDKLKPTQYKKRLEEIKEELPNIGDVSVIPFSAVNGSGVEELKQLIESCAQ